MADKIITEFELDISGFQEAINKAIDGMEGLEQSSGGTQKNIDGLDGKVGSAAKKVKELGVVSDESSKGLKAASKEAQGFGAAMSQVKGELSKTFPVITKLITLSKSLGTAITTALGPVGLVIAAVAAGFALLAKVFLGTQEGADKLSKIIEPLKAGLQATLGVIQQVASTAAKAVEVLGKLLTGDFSGAAKSFDELKVSARETGNAIANIGSTLADASRSGARLAAIKKELSLLAIETAKQEGTLNRQFQEQVQLAQDVNLSGKEREAAAQKAIETQKEITALKVRELDLLIEELTIKQSLNSTTDAELAQLEQLKSQREQARADEISATRRITNTLNSLRKQEADKAIAEAKRVAEERQKLEEQRVAAAQKTSEIIAAAELKDELSRLDATSRKVREIELGYEREVAAAREAFKALSDISPEGERAAIAEQEARAVAAIEGNLQAELAQLRDQEAAIGRKRVADATEELRVALTSRADLERQAIEERFARLSELAVQTIDDEVTLTETLVELERQRGEAIDAVQDEAFEADRARQQQRLELYKQTSGQVGELLGALGTGAISSAEDVSKALLSIALDAAEKQAQIAAANIVAKEIGTKGFAGIATGALLAGLIAAAFAGLRSQVLAPSSTPKFYDGGVVGRDGGTKVHGGRDGYLARVHNGEYIMPTAKTGRYMPYLEAMRDGRFESMMDAHRSYRSTQTAPVTFSDRGIVGALGSVGSLSEQRKQTELLGMLAERMARKPSKRYWA
jgi:hypothetical protein